MAAETFNDGLRVYYFSFAVMGWLFSPYVFMAATLGVVWVFYRREFRSACSACSTREPALARP